MTQPFYLLSVADTFGYLAGLVTVPCQAMWKPEAKGKISNIDCVLKKNCYVAYHRFFKNELWFNKILH